MKKLQPTTAIVAGVIILALMVVYFFGPSLGVSAEAYDALLAFGGATGVVVAAALRALFGRDTDGDGIPDLLDGDTK